MQKPTLCIYKCTRIPIWYTRAYSTPDGHLLLLVFEIIRLFEVSQVSISQKQALVNAIKYVCSLTLLCHADTPA